jgi:hypothetical protein
MLRGEIDVTINDPPPARGPFAILARHQSMEPAFVRSVPRTGRDPMTDVVAWITWEPHEMATFPDAASAKIRAEELATLFVARPRDGSVYRFDPIERRPVARWFLAGPADDRERQPLDLEEYPESEGGG